MAEMPHAMMDGATPGNLGGMIKLDASYTYAEVKALEPSPDERILIGCSNEVHLCYWDGAAWFTVDVTSV